MRAMLCRPPVPVPMSPCPRPRPHAPPSPRPGALPFLTQHGTIRRDPQPPALGPAWRLWEPRPCPGRHTWEPRREALPRLGGFPGPPQALAPAQPGARSRASPSRLPCEAFGALCFENILKTLGSPNNMSKTFLFSAEKVERLFLSRKCGPGSPPALSRGRQRGRWAGCPARIPSRTLSAGHTRSHRPPGQPPRRGIPSEHMAFVPCPRSQHPRASRGRAALCTDATEFGAGPRAGG